MVLKNALRLLLFGVILLFGVQVFAQNTNPYSAIKYDSVVIYEFNSNETRRIDYSIIDDSGKLAPSVSKSTKLNDKEITELIALLGEKSSFGNIAAICFEPHLGIVYYNNGKPEDYISICMGCNRLESNLEIPAQKQGVLIGMSKTLRKFLNNLLEDNNFTHTILTSTIYDQ